MHAIFFLFFLNEYKICLPGGRRILAHVFRGPRILGLWLMFSKVLDPSSCFQKPRILGLWHKFSKDQRFWILAHVFRDLGFLDLWLMFSEDQGFWVLAHVFRGPKVPDLGSCFQRPRILGLGSCFQRTKGFLGFGSCFQRTKGSGSWLMFSET